MSDVESSEDPWALLADPATAVGSPTVPLRREDATALCDAWQRLEDAQAEQAEALVDLVRLCSELGVLSASELGRLGERHLSAVPDSR